jgi:hypothetical protein
VAIAEDDDLGLQAEGFFNVVGNGDNGDAAVEEGFAKLRKDGVAERAVDAGEGLVEQHELRIRDTEGAREIDALTLAAGEIFGITMDEVFEAKELDGVVDIFFGDY